MASVIYFAGSTGDGALTLRVSEDPDDVANAYANARGEPFTLTLAKSGDNVWINPSLAVYWRKGKDSRPVSMPRSGR